MNHIHLPSSDSVIGLGALAMDRGLEGGGERGEGESGTTDKDRLLL